MVFLCQCLVKFAQKEGDESNLSPENDSQGRFLSIKTVYVSCL